MAMTRDTIIKITAGIIGAAALTYIALRYWNDPERKADRAQKAKDDIDAAASDSGGKLQDKTAASSTNTGSLPTKDDGDKSPFPLLPNSQSPFVYTVQMHLIQMGAPINNGVPTGKWGAQTSNALLRFGYSADQLTQQDVQDIINHVKRNKK